MYYKPYIRGKVMKASAPQSQDKQHTSYNIIHCYLEPSHSNRRPKTFEKRVFNCMPTRNPSNMIQFCEMLQQIEHHTVMYHSLDHSALTGGA